MIQFKKVKAFAENKMLNKNAILKNKNRVARKLWPTESVYLGALVGSPNSPLKCAIKGNNSEIVKLIAHTLKKDSKANSRFIVKAQNMLPFFTEYKTKTHNKPLKRQRLHDLRLIFENELNSLPDQKTLSLNSNNPNYNNCM